MFKMVVSRNNLELVTGFLTGQFFRVPDLLGIFGKQQSRQTWKRSFHAADGTVIILCSENGCLKWCEARITKGFIPVF